MTTSAHHVTTTCFSRTRCGSKISHAYGNGYGDVETILYFLWALSRLRCFIFSPPSTTDRSVHKKYLENLQSSIHYNMEKFKTIKLI